jgi:hypothetical protein
MDIQFSNNGHSTLASSISSSDTSVTVASGHGSRFPSLTGSEYFFATLIDSSNNLEIVKVTARSSDVLTVTRAQESTTARAYGIGDRIELRATAAGLNAIYTEAVADAIPGTDTITAAMIQANAVGSSEIAADAVGSSEIAANAVGASELNVSGNGTSGQSLLSDGDGTFSWGSGGKVIACTVVYNSDTAGSGGTSRSLSGEDFNYRDGNLVSGQFTKQQSSSKLVVNGQLSQIMTSGNWHDTHIWIGSNATGSVTQNFHIGHDNYRMDSNRTNFGFNAVFTGVGTGTYYCNMTAGRGDSGSSDGVRNYNPQSYVSADTSNTNTNSMLVVWEVL